MARPSPSCGTKLPELVSGIGHGDRLGRIRNAVAGQKLNPFRTGEAIGVEAELQGETPGSAG